MADVLKVKEAVEWYSKNRIVYEALAKKVESITREILDSKNINYHSVTSRTKSISRYKEKASEEKYMEPLSEIKDMAGIRVVTYTNSEAREVSEIIKEAFKIDPKQSIDKAEELGIDRVGYRGIHYVGNLGKVRCKLPENKIFKNHVFEIQIRSMLQHSWAEFEHDRNYKFAGVLPKEIQRRLFIAAGNLEAVDREFDNLAKAIDAYTIEVEKKTELGDFSEPINSKSLKAYMYKKFGSLVKEELISPELKVDDVVIEELSIMGIDTLEKLEDIIPEDFVDKVRTIYLEKAREEKGHNFTGAIRQVMIIHDASTYFGKAWRNRWHVISPSTVSIARHWGVKIENFLKKYKLIIKT